MLSALENKRDIFLEGHLRIALVTHEQIVKVAGGAEKVFVNMANEFTARGHDVTGCYFGESDAFPAFKLSEKVKLINLHRHSLIDKNICDWNKREVFLYRCLLRERNFDDYQRKTAIMAEFIRAENIDVVVCYFTYVLKEISFCYTHSVPIVLMLHSEPGVYLKQCHKNNLPVLLSVFEKADMLQVLLPSYKKTVRSWGYDGRVAVIQNAVELVAPMKKVHKKKKIVCVARIDTVKRVDLLLNAFSIIANETRGWQVHHYGEVQHEGKYCELLKKISEYGLSDRFIMHGAVSNIQEEISNASIFVLPSEYEGFPIALAEAMASRLPCIGFRVCSGVNELIVDGSTGMLTEMNENSLASAILALVNNESLRNSMGNKGYERIRKYAAEAIWGKWNELISFITNVDYRGKKTKNITFKKILVVLFSKYANKFRKCFVALFV